MLVSGVSPAQERALNRLLAFQGEWACAIRVQESLSTLNALVRKGYALRRDYAQTKQYHAQYFDPRSHIEYRAHPQLIAMMRQR